MAGPTILVVDDEQNIAELTKLYLTNEGYQVVVAHDGQEALDKVQSEKPALVVLDLMMPGIDGLEVTRQLRKAGNIPIIMLTARGDDIDKIVGFELGADDYVTKPFQPRELVARVKAVLRRTQPAERPPEDVIAVGDVRMDLARREVTINGQDVRLRAKEFELLKALAAQPGIVFNRDRLLNQVWGYDFYGDTRTVDVHVTHLREKLSDSGSVQIRTVWGVGYKLVVENA